MHCYNHINFTLIECFKVLNLIWLSLSCVPRDSSFILNEFLPLNLDVWFGVLSKNLLFFDIPSLYYYVNFRSSIIFYLSSGDIYFSLGISLSCSCVIVTELLCGELLETFIILLTILSPIKSPVASAVFGIFFSEVLSASVGVYLP